MKKLIIFFLIFFQNFIFAYKTSDVDSNELFSFSKLYEKTMKATVAIIVSYDYVQDDDAKTFDEFLNGNCEEKGLGSGFVISEDGYILTNNHVVEEGNVYEIHFSDDSKCFAELIGTDERSDIAILKVDKKDLPYLNFETTDVNIGQWVYVVGNPLSLELQSSLSVGIVSGKDRVDRCAEIEDDIQLNICVHPGNSGSPALNLNGKVIGMIKSGMDPTVFGSGIVFIIPSFILKKVTDQLINNGKIIDGKFGIQKMEKKDDTFIITSIAKGSSADEAGLEQNDQILEYNNIQMTSLLAFYTYMKLMDVDETLNLKIQRDGKRFIISLKKE